MSESASQDQPGAAALRQLPFFRPTESGEKVRVKVCGLTTMEQAREVAALGVDALGFNFWPKSKRYLPEGAEREALPGLDGEVTRVGLFVNADGEEIEEAFAKNWIDVAQLHGDEAPEEIDDWLARGYPVFRGVGVRDEVGLEALAAIPGPALLMDAYAPTAYGGTGEVMDWALGSRAVEQWPDRFWLLAGGLKPGNVAEAVQQVQPTAVDVASGVESSPGVKDLALVRAFVEAARA